MTIEAFQARQAEHMDPSRIGRLEANVPPLAWENDPDNRIVSAALIASGDFVRLPTTREVFGAVVILDYLGYKFGDGRQTTGLVASIKPLCDIGIKRVEDELEMVLEAGELPGVAKFAGEIAAKEAEGSYHRAYLFGLYHGKVTDK